MAIIGREKEINEFNELYNSGKIDLLLIRDDHVVNMCEMKFYNDEYSITKAYHKTLVHRQNLLGKELPSHTVVHATLVTTEGLKYNEYSGDFQQVITLDELFEG